MVALDLHTWQTTFLAKPWPPAAFDYLYLDAALTSYTLGRLVCGDLAYHLRLSSNPKFSFKIGNLEPEVHCM